MRTDNKNFNPPSYNGSNDYYPLDIGCFSYEDATSDGYWKEFRQEVLKIREKSQDDFEKYLNIFGSGGLLVGFTLLSKLVETKVIYEYQFILISGNILFVICLLSNLLSHHIAISNNDRNIADVDSKCKNLWGNFEKRNSTLGYINWVSLGSIILGTILITLFLILNLKTMAKQNQTPDSKSKTTQSEPKPLNEQKGRTTVNPVFQKPPKTK